MGGGEKRLVELPIILGKWRNPKCGRALYSWGWDGNHLEESCLGIV